MLDEIIEKPVIMASLQVTTYENYLALLYKDTDCNAGYVTVKMDEAIEMINVTQDNSAKLLFKKRKTLLKGYEWTLSEIHIPENIMFNK